MLMQWLESFKNAKRETKWFVLNWALYGVLLVLTTLYCYARLDFVRSYAAPIPVFKSSMPKTEAPKDSPKDSPKP